MTDATPRIRVMVVDDHPLLREGVAAVIQMHADMLLVAEAADGREAIERYRQHRPDITLMDLRLPGIDGVGAITAIRHEHPQARIIVLTTYKGDVRAVRAFKAGACGYLLKSMVRKELIETIRSVHEGQRRIPPEIASEIAEHVSEDALSAREIEVLASAASGRGNKAIAAQLGISEDTVKAHMKSILSKLFANDRTHAVTIALKRGIIDV